MSPSPLPAPGEARIAGTAGTREEPWAKAAEHVGLLNEHGLQRRWLVSVIPLRASVFRIKSEPVRATHLSEES